MGNHEINIKLKHQGCHSQKVHGGIFTENCNALYIQGTERVILIDGNPKGDKISLGHCAHLLTNLRGAVR